MRTPPGYEDMIEEVAQAAAKHGFYLIHDTLDDYPPNGFLPGSGHKFEVCVHLYRQADDFKEDNPSYLPRGA